MPGAPPRHIRDIAHLYLSGARSTRAITRRVIVAGMSADVIPAFHTANLALAAAVRGLDVHVEDRSGLPVNAGCFLGLDPACWAPRGVARGTEVAAFARVTFRLAPADGGGPAPGAAARDALVFVHAPPHDDGEGHRRAVDEELARGAGATVLYLAARDDVPRPWRPPDARPGVTRQVAFVARTARAAADPACAGTFTRWTRALTDPLPPLVRDSGSHLSRQYADALAVLLAAPAAGARGGVHAGAAREPR